MKIEITSKTFDSVVDDDTLKDTYHEFINCFITENRIEVIFDSYKSQSIKNKHKNRAKLKDKLSVTIEGSDFDDVIALIETKVKNKLSIDGHTVVDV